MSMLAGPAIADKEHLRELQERALRIRAQQKWKSQGLGAGLFEWQQTTLETSLSPLAQELMTLQESHLRILAADSTEWAESIPGSKERLMDLLHRLITQRMIPLHEQGQFQQGIVLGNLVALENAASQKDYKTFTHLARTIDWSHYSPRALTKAIDLALAVDMVPLARDLALKGRELFPSDERVRQAARVLAPPFLVRMRPHQTTDFEASQRWLRDHSAEYKGKWIAVRGGQLLGSAATLSALYQQIASEGRTPNTIVTKVLL